MYYTWQEYHYSTDKYKVLVDDSPDLYKVFDVAYAVDSYEMTKTQPSLSNGTVINRGDVEQESTFHKSIKLKSDLTWGHVQGIQHGVTTTIMVY